jgi:Novel STAND NTPase 1
VADPPPAPPEDPCPYVGLQPFTAKDAAYFFGRERERRIVSANLFAAPLTVLYGPSAVGKSSVLQAGVVSHLSAEPRTAVVYFASWQGDDYVARLKAECLKAISAVHTSPVVVDAAVPLDEWIASAMSQFRGVLLVMLDQFEEYLLYHREDAAAAFDAELARVVNSHSSSAHVLIGLRDDSLSKLNRFSKRIPNLLGNTLQLRRLSAEAARRAIVGPIERYAADHPGERPTRLEPSLVDRIVAEVQIENVAATLSGGIAGVQASEDRGLIETAFLQLVMTELWRAASARPGDRVLDAATLDSLGGAKAIVRRHVEKEVGQLAPAERDIAAKLFLHLVTPSGAKYALRTEDLVELAGQPREQVSRVLTALAGARILRRLDPPERYEIFHDAFAAALIEWRKEYLHGQAQQEALRAAEQQRARERAELVRRRRWQAALMSTALLLSGIGVYVVHQQRDRAELSARLEISKAQQETAVAAMQAAQVAAQQSAAEKRAADTRIAAREAALDVDRATLQGDRAKAEALRRDQQEKQRSADAAKAEAERLARESQEKLAAVNRAQTRLQDAVQDANAKGYNNVAPPIEVKVPPPADTPPPKPDTPPPPTKDPAVTTPPADRITGDYKDPYRKAMAARDRKRWSDAQTQLEAALRSNPKDTGETIIISGAGNVEPYVPHYYLGVVMKAQDKCSEAVKEFDLSEKDEAIKKTRLYRSLQQQRDACASGK